MRLKWTRITKPGAAATAVAMSVAANTTAGACANSHRHVPDPYGGAATSASLRLATAGMACITLLPFTVSLFGIGALGPNLHP